MNPADLSATIERALLTVMDVEDFELTERFDGKEIDISGDDWTWHIEDELSFLAVDDEPDDPAGYPETIERNLTAPVLDAFRQIEPATLVVLRAALAASRDPLSLIFAELLLPATP